MDDSSEKRARTSADIVRHVAEFHEQLPRNHADQIGAIYARYSSRHQDSIVDQVRTLLQEALQKSIFVPAEFIFYDMSVRGYKNDREGLNGLRTCLEKRSVKVVLFFATNRLFRKNYRSLQFVEEQVVERGIRAIFVKSGVDTADSKRWRALMNVRAMMDEFVVSMNIDNIRASHEGLIEKSLVFGTITYGYKGEDIPGQLTRKGRPRRSLVRDELAAATVRDIFRWYVTDRITIQQITRQLSIDPQYPRPLKSRGRGWSRDAVRRILMNTRYRGLWHYGALETVWVSSRDYARQLKRDEPLKSIQLDALRIVDDDLWFQAQALLKHEAAKVVGRKPRDGERQSRPRIMDDMFICPTHNRRLYVGGKFGRVLFCRDCRRMLPAERPLFSLLRRQTALQLTCEAIANLIRADPELVSAIVAVSQRAAQDQQAPDPSVVASLQAKLQKQDTRIEWVLRNPGETEQDRQQSAKILKDIRRERAVWQAELDALQALAQKPIVVPKAEELKLLLGNMERILMETATGSDVPSGRVRQLIELVTGGRIELFPTSANVTG